MNYKHILFSSLVFCSVISFIFSGCNSKQKLALKELALKDQAVDQYLDSLDDAQKISQVFLENIESNKKYYTVEYESSVDPSFSSEKPLVSGGVILFSFNVADNAPQLMAYTNSIRQVYSDCGNPQPYIAIDQEGGLVNRLRKINSPLKEQKEVAQKLSVEDALKLYDFQGQQMALLGFNMNLAPVVEIETEDNKEFLDGRSFGTVEQVNAYAESAIKGYEKNRIGTVMKHFPGNTNADPHSLLPEMDVTQQQLDGLFEPFIHLSKLQPAAVLMSHIVMKVSDSETQAIPSCLSTYWVNDVLRSKIGFSGLVLSDDIFMGALQQNGYPPEKAAVMAIEAGVDVIMISEKKFGSTARILYRKAVEDPVFAQKLRQAEKKVLQYKLDYGVLEYVKNEDGTYTVQNKIETSSLEERMQRFEQVRSQAVEFTSGRF